MNKTILGFVGLLSSGKGTAAKYLETKYSANTYRYSTILRDLVDRIYVEQSRDNLIKMSETIRSTFGEDTLAKAIAKDAETAINNLVVVEGIRRPADIEYLAKLPNFVLIEIFAEPKTRYERLIKRGENADDNSKTYEQFLADHQRSTELSILEVIPHAKERIDNNGNLENLYQQLDRLVGRYVD
jgi:dephospho-CoA kinase